MDTEKFLAYVQQENKVEPKDVMPDDYRKLLVRQISQHAHSEVVGMLPEANWITRAPSLRRKMALLAKIQDEAGHGLYLYAATETLGNGEIVADRDSTYNDMLSGKAKYQKSMNYRVKRESNDSLRQRFVDVTVPQAEFLGLKIPDEKLKWNEERQHYDFGDLPWDEFMEVLKGNGPCNKKRLETKRKAQQENAWVKDAAMAYAAKKNELNESAS